MSKTEINELMSLRGWSKAALAAALDCSEHAVYKWLETKQQPSGPASILMRMWLQEARKEAGNNGHRKELVKA